MDVCTGLKKLHSDNGCCGNTGSAMCVANPAQHYLGMKSRKLRIHPASHDIVHKHMDNITVTHIHFRCPSNDTYVTREVVTQVYHGDEDITFMTSSGSFLRLTSQHVTKVYNSRNKLSCYSRVAQRRGFSYNSFHVPQADTPSYHTLFFGGAYDAVSAPSEEFYSQEDAPYGFHMPSDSAVRPLDQSNLYHPFLKFHHDLPPPGPEAQ